MNPESSVASVRPRPDRAIYTWAALVAVLIVFAGFARSYYLKGLFGTPALTGLVHLHGVVMSLWFALFATQVWLVARGRTGVHRRLGVAGGAIAIAVIAVGTLTAITAARLGHTPGPPPKVFLAVPLGEMVVFAALVSLGLTYRHRPAAHKRLLLLASLSMLTPAIARLPLDFIRSGGIPVFFALTDLCLVACIAVDTARHRRLHPAFGWGLLFVFVSQGFRLWLSGTPLWDRVATWLVG